MPKATYTRQILHTTDADFRQWATDLSTALKACLTQAADTGQVDWTLGTQTKPGASTYPYYEMYRFSDALQATKPVFIKVEYGSQSTITNPAIRVTVGGATNGAGTVTVPSASGYIQVVSSTSAAAAMQTTWVCYKDGYFGLNWGAPPSPSIGSCHLFFLFDRSRDASGVGIPNGYYWCYHITPSGAGAAGSYSLDVLAIIAPCGSGNCLISNHLAYSSVAAKTKLYPHRIFTPDEYAVTGMLGFYGVEITPYTEFDVAPLPGMATQHYLHPGNVGLGINVMAATQFMTAMRYET